MRCELRQGALVGLTPVSAAFSGALDCFMPIVPRGSGMELEIEGGRSRILADGESLAPTSTGTYFISRPNSVSAISAELASGDSASVRFRVTPPTRAG